MMDNPGGRNPCRGEESYANICFWHHAMKPRPPVAFKKRHGDIFYLLKTNNFLQHSGHICHELHTNYTPLHIWTHIWNTSYETMQFR